MDLFYYLAVLVVSALVSYALAPEPPKPKPAHLKDFDIPTADEGRPIPVVFGTRRVTGPNVVWYGNLRSEAIKSSSGK